MRTILVKCDRCGKTQEYENEKGISATGWHNVSLFLIESRRSSTIICRECYKKYDALIRECQRSLGDFFNPTKEILQEEKDVPTIEEITFWEYEYKHQTYNPGSYTTEGYCPNCGKRVERPFTKPTGVCPCCGKPAFWDEKDFQQYLDKVKNNK